MTSKGINIAGILIKLYKQNQATCSRQQCIDSKIEQDWSLSSRQGKEWRKRKKNKYLKESE